MAVGRPYVVPVPLQPEGTPWGGLTRAVGDRPGSGGEAVRRLHTGTPCTGDVAGNHASYPTAAPVTALRFSPDGFRLAFAAEGQRALNASDAARFRSGLPRHELDWRRHSSASRSPAPVSWRAAR